MCTRSHDTSLSNGDSTVGSLSTILQYHLIYQFIEFDLLLVHFPCSLQYVPINVRYPPEWHYDAEKTEIRLGLSHFLVTFRLYQFLLT